MAASNNPARTNDDASRATAHLPGLDIEIVHRRSPAGDSEQLSINLQAVPSFDAFGRFVEDLNPLVFWTQAVRMMWAPWLGVASGMLGPASLAAPLMRIAPRDHSITPEQEPS